MMQGKAVRVTAVGIVTAGLVVGMVAWAIPAEAAVREDRGTCSAGARYELEVERERSRLDISFSVDAAMPRERWNVRITNNGQQVARLNRTADSDGEWDFDRVVRDSGSGARIVVEATSASGQTCRGSVRI
jgi:hypothetical protein